MSRSWSVDKEYASFYCDNCRARTRAERNDYSVSAVQHVVFSVVTVGCWAPIALAFILFGGRWRCLFCASPVGPTRMQLCVRRVIMLVVVAGVLGAVAAFV